jgi:hypothetical protein
MQNIFADYNRMLLEINNKVKLKNSQNCGNGTTYSYITSGTNKKSQRKLD